MPNNSNGFFIIFWSMIVKRFIGIISNNMILINHAFAFTYNK